MECAGCDKCGCWVYVDPNPILSAIATRSYRWIGLCGWASTQYVLTMATCQQAPLLILIQYAQLNGKVPGKDLTEDGRNGGRNHGWS